MPNKHVFGLGRPRTEVLWRVFFPEKNSDLTQRLASVKRAARENTMGNVQDTSIMALVFADYVRIEKVITRNSLVQNSNKQRYVEIYHLVHNFLILIPGNEVYVSQLNGAWRFDLFALQL